MLNVVVFLLAGDGAFECGHNAKDPRDGIPLFSHVGDHVNVKMPDRGHTMFVRPGDTSEIVPWLFIAMLGDGVSVGR
jgi:hypothetical protein